MIESSSEVVGGSSPVIAYTVSKSKSLTPLHEFLDHLMKGLTGGFLIDEQGAPELVIDPVQPSRVPTRRVDNPAKLQARL